MDAGIGFSEIHKKLGISTSESGSEAIQRKGRLEHEETAEKNSFSDFGSIDAADAIARLDIC